MHPAFSVILFTTLTGSGYGLLALLGLHTLWRPLPLAPTAAMATIGFALALVTIGLLASLMHLGQPQRAWRALSQWRTSWLSREGVAALLTYVPALLLAWFAWREMFTPASRATGLLLSGACGATVACTAMIYASLPPIAAWRDRAVLPAYLGYALLGGALWFGAVVALATRAPGVVAGAVVLLLTLALALLKHFYWRRIDAAPPSPSTAAAVGLPAIGTVRSFERPHTETNYLLHEMGFVLARRHARRLRRLAVLAGLMLPLLLVAVAVTVPAFAAPLWWLAALIFQLGALLERWLFFAQARHTIASYYGIDAAR